MAGLKMEEIVNWMVLNRRDHCTEVVPQCDYVAREMYLSKLS